MRLRLVLIGAVLVAVCGQNPAPHLLEERLKVYCHPPGCGYNTARDEHYQLSDAQLPRAWVAGWRRAVSFLGLTDSSRGQAEFSLRFLTGVFRHGDRSGMTDIPHTDKPRWDCSVPVDDDAAIAIFRTYRAQYEAYECIIDPPLNRNNNIAAWNGTAQIEIDPGSGTAVDLSDSRPHCGPEAAGRTYPPNPGSKGLKMGMHLPGTACEGGQLTYTGMQQHLRLGTVFRELLTKQSTRFNVSPDATTRIRMEGSPLIPVGRENDEHLVRFTSTNYGRTVLSASSFWTGFAPLSGANGAILSPLHNETDVLAAARSSYKTWSALGGHAASKQPEPALSQSNDNDRVVRVVPRELDPLLAAKDHPRCPLAVRIKEELRSRVGRFKTLTGTGSGAVKRLAAIGGAYPTVAEQAGSMRTLSAADLINTRLCSGQALPCALDASRLPMTEDKRRAEPDDPGTGRCLSSAAAAGILRNADRDYGQRLGGPDVSLLMFPSLKGIAVQLRAAHERRTSLRFSPRFAHDTVVYPLLAALGAGDSEWPGYASRITFELWSLSYSNTEAEAQIEDDSKEQIGLVRVLFQGEDITPNLRCSSSWGHGKGSDQNGQLHAQAWLALAGSACTVQSFELQVDELIAPYASYAEACSLGPAGPAAVAGSNATSDADGDGSNRAGPF